MLQFYVLRMYVIFFLFFEFIVEIVFCTKNHVGLTLKVIGFLRENERRLFASSQKSGVQFGMMYVRRCGRKLKEHEHF